MSVVLVHGNPETAAIWDDLREQLGRDDVIALSPPGFGAPVPDGFRATSDEYAAWLATKVAKLPPPLDLVGHDWGGGHVVRLVIAQPELVRSWAMEDHLRWPAGESIGELHGYGHYHETYVKLDDGWRISSTKLTRLRLDVS